jgi:quercetin dioxygenase-like cupin family protein
MQREVSGMAFRSWHSRHDEPPVSIPAIGLDLYVRLPDRASDGAITVIETVNAPGFGPPLHRHAETEVFRVMHGRYLFEVDGKRFLGETGDVISVPGGAAHAFVNVTDAPARQIVIIIPGLDALAFFTQLGDIMRGGIPGRDALNRFGRRWGMEFLGPPISPD